MFQRVLSIYKEFLFQFQGFLFPIPGIISLQHTYGYRSNRGAKDAIRKIKEYAEQGYTKAVVLDLSKYFDTLNHELLLNILRRNVKDERVIQLIKRYLKSGVKRCSHRDE